MPLAPPDERFRGGPEAIIKACARVANRRGTNTVTLSTNGNEHGLDVPQRSAGFGSSINGGEWLFLALATCSCNGVHRKAAGRGIQVQQVTVEVEGEPGRNLTYHARHRSWKRNRDPLTDGAR